MANFMIKLDESGDHLLTDKGIEIGSSTFDIKSNGTVVAQIDSNGNLLLKGSVVKLQ